LEGHILGFVAAKNFLLKKMPGRIYGMTTDSKGERLCAYISST
jgi:glycine cleavage system pyridoxal-binding protein P